MGVRFDDRVTGKLPDFAPAAKAASAAGTGGIIHFDILPKNVNKVVRPDVAVVGDCKLSLKAMMPMIEPNGEFAVFQCIALSVCTNHSVLANVRSCYAHTIHDRMQIAPPGLRLCVNGRKATHSNTFLLKMISR